MPQPEVSLEPEPKERDKADPLPDAAEPVPDWESSYRERSVNSLEAQWLALLPLSSGLLSLQFQLIQPFQPNLDSGANIFFLACRAQIPASEFTAEVGEAFSMPMYGNRPTRIPVLRSLAASTFSFCMCLNISTNGKLHRFWQLFLKQVQLKWGAAP